MEHVSKQVLLKNWIGPLLQMGLGKQGKMSVKWNKWKVLLAREDFLLVQRAGRSLWFPFVDKMMVKLKFRAYFFNRNISFGYLYHQFFL